MTVRHPQYGLGTIIDVDGFAKNRKVTVQFREGDRRQTFVVAKSPLQPVGLD
jgi:DNA helicase-2/ATP-dependent DNA helicase PcrA